MLVLNDKVYGLLTRAQYEGEVTLGVPQDIVYPAIPQVLQRFAMEFPKVKVRLMSSFMLILKDQFDRGECDLIVTTEDGLDSGGETLTELQLIWVGAPGGQAWRLRPLALAYEQLCIFRQGVQERLDAAGVSSVLAVDSDTTRTVEATVSADLAVHTVLEGTESRHTELPGQEGTLPNLRWVNINFCDAHAVRSASIDALARFLRHVHAGKRAKMVSVDRAKTLKQA